MAGRNAAVCCGPCTRGLSTFNPFCGKLFAAVSNYRHLQQENDRLRQQLAEAVALQTKIAELRQENNRLRGMLELREASEYELIAAEVIARDPSSWFNIITINKGTKDGVRENMAVITTEGLIGSILSPLLIQHRYSF